MPAGIEVTNTDHTVASRGVRVAAFFLSGRRSGRHRTVAVGNPRGLKHADKIEQEMAESCNRLIKNCIICWNHIYMTRRFEATGSPEERDRLLSMIAVHSPQSIESESRLRA